MPSSVLDAGSRLGSETGMVPVTMERSVHCTGGEGQQTNV